MELLPKKPKKKPSHQQQHNIGQQSNYLYCTCKIKSSHSRLDWGSGDICVWDQTEQRQRSQSARILFSHAPPDRGHVTYNIAVKEGWSKGLFWSEERKTVLVARFSRRRRRRKTAIVALRLVTYPETT